MENNDQSKGQSNGCWSDSAAGFLFPPIKVVLLLFCFLFSPPFQNLPLPSVSNKLNACRSSSISSSLISGFADVEVGVMLLIEEEFYVVIINMMMKISKKKLSAAWVLVRVFDVRLCQRYV